MRVLLYEWESYLQYDVKYVFKEKNIEFDTFAWKFIDKNTDDKFCHWFTKNVDISKYGLLFSINYWPLLSQMAQSKGLRYIAWCYDNPLNVVNIEDTLGNDVNKVIFFDRIQAQKYIDKGFATVYYMPLCVNRTRLQKLNITTADMQRYSADVALVGSLYESRLNDIKNLADDYTKGYIDAAISSQQNIYGCYLLDDMITETVVERINANIHKKYPETQFHIVKEALTFAMASEIARRERLLLLTLSGRRFDTKLYSFQSSEILKGVKCMPQVDYVEEMPKVFGCTKINLNPSLRCIQSGIPLRALDVMGTGGFLLSNYQIELAEYFIQGEEMEMYESIEDAIAKEEFYLKNEELRAHIAANGKRKVFEEYAMQDKIGSMLCD